MPSRAVSLVKKIVRCRDCFGMEVLMGVSVLCVVLGANWTWKQGEEQVSPGKWQRQLKELVSEQARSSLGTLEGE